MPPYYHPLVAGTPLSLGTVHIHIVGVPHGNLNDSSYTEQYGIQGSVPGLVVMMVLLLQVAAIV